MTIQPVGDYANDSERLVPDDIAAYGGLSSNSR
jgi:hypothetical protein